MTIKIAVADSETATLQGPVCDIGVIEIDEELNEIRRHGSLIDPQVKIAPSAQAIHHITDAMVADQPTMVEYIERDGNPFEADELIIIGHNIGFDCRMFDLTPGLLPEKYTKVCTLRMARNLWPNIDPDRESHKLEVLSIMFGLETGTAHRAVGDCVTALSLLKHIADVAGVGSFKELVELGTKPLSLETYITFGKHGPNGSDKADKRGTKLKDLPSSYVKWLLSQRDMDPDLLAALATRTK